MPRAAERIANQLQSIDITTFENDERDRVKLLAAAQALCQRLETPSEFVQRVTVQEPAFIACLKIADDIKLFNHLSTSPSSVAALAGPTETDPVLLKRILRHLASKDVVAEVAVPISPLSTSSTLASVSIPESTGSFIFRPRLGSRASSTATSRTSSLSTIPVEVHYASTRISQCLTTREASATIRQAVNIHYPILLHLPQYLASVGYTSPSDQEDGPFQASPLGSQGLAYHKWLERPTNAAHAQDDTDASQFHALDRRSWMDIYDPTPLLSAPVSVPSSRRASTATTTNGTNTPPPPLPNTIPVPPDQTPPLLVDFSPTAPSSSPATCAATSLLFRKHFPPTSNTHAGAVELLIPPAHLDALATNTDLAIYHVTLVAHARLQPLRPHSAAARIYLLGPDVVPPEGDDDDATRLLAHVAAAMAPGGASRLLIWDRMVERVAPHPGVSGADVLRLALGVGGCRDEDEWRELVGGVPGLEVLAVHRDKDRRSGMIVVECFLA